jgi:hypothetical protein
MKPKWSRREFELRSGDAVLGTLVWKRGSRALAELGESRYSFERKGWLNSRITVQRDSSSQEMVEPLATFSPHGGILSVSDGRRYVWKKPQSTSASRRWTRERVWIDEPGAELVRFHPAKHSSVEVTIPPETSPQPDLPLLILLGQYLIALSSQDAETAAMAGTVAVIASS